MAELPSIEQCLQRASALTVVSDSPRLDIEILLTAVLEKSRTWLYTWPEKTLTEDELARFNDFFQRRLAGEPVAHIIGQREFWSLPLLVDGSTLIPRPDTELLVETVLELFSQDDPAQPRRLLDLGTGTGAIVLALASEKKSWHCVAADNAEAAVALAEKNRARLQLENVRIMRSNWFAAFPPATTFDIIVSNPPYIDPQDPHLQQGDLRFEPLSALVAENNGLADLQIIVAQAVDYLATDGWLAVEHGYDQGAAVRKLFTQYGYCRIATRRDLGNKERVTFGQKINLQGNPQGGEHKAGEHEDREHKGRK